MHDINGHSLELLLPSINKSLFGRNNGVSSLKLQPHAISLVDTSF